MLRRQSHGKFVQSTTVQIDGKRKFHLLPKTILTSPENTQMETCHNKSARPSIRSVLQRTYCPATWSIHGVHIWASLSYVSFSSRLRCKLIIPMFLSIPHDHRHDFWKRVPREDRHCGHQLLCVGGGPHRGIANQRTVYGQDIQVS